MPTSAVSHYGRQFSIQTMEAKTGISVFECKRAGIKTEKRRRASHVERNRRSQHVCVSRMTAGAGSPGSPLTPIGHAPSFDTGVAALARSFSDAYA